jgi:hypothetical protein
MPAFSCKDFTKPYPVSRPRFELGENIWVQDAVTEGWRNLHNEIFHNSYVSLNIIRLSNERRIRWAVH